MTGRSQARPSVLARALVRWQHAADSYWPYVCAAPFLGEEDEFLVPGSWFLVGERGLSCHPSLRSGSVFPPARGRLLCSLQDDRASARSPSSWSRLADRLASAGRLALFVDLPPERTLASAPGLIEAGFLVVPVVQRWVAAGAVIPCRRLVELLVGVGQRLRRPGRTRGVVLLLDGARFGPPPAQAPRAPRGFDNRYTLRADRFPPVEFLRQDGVERVCWLAPDGIAPDLLRYVQVLESGGYLVEALPAPGRRARR